jgi:hypothetical protein
MNITIKSEKDKYIFNCNLILKTFLIKIKFILEKNYDTSFQDLSFSKSALAALSVVYWANMLVFLLHGNKK